MNYLCHILLVSKLLGYTTKYIITLKNTEFGSLLTFSLKAITDLPDLFQVRIPRALLGEPIPDPCGRFSRPRAIESNKIKERCLDHCLTDVNLYGIVSLCDAAKVVAIGRSETSRKLISSIKRLCIEQMS